MKKRRIVIFCLSVLTASTAGANETGPWSLGLDLGQARSENNENNLNHRLSHLGFNAQADVDDNNRFAWQLRLGYRFTPRWGIEAGYVDLGEQETSLSGSTSDINAFLSAASELNPTTADGFTLQGVYRQSLGASARLKGVVRAGAFFWSSQYSLKGAAAERKVEESGADFSAGLGMELDLSGLSRLPDGTTLHLDWQRFNLDSEAIDLFSLGLSHRFGHPR